MCFILVIAQLLSYGHAARYEAHSFHNLNIASEQNRYAVPESILYRIGPNSCKSHGEGQSFGRYYPLYFGF